jgi:mono/diheme cytochrome c family protein
MEWRRASRAHAAAEPSGSGDPVQITTPTGALNRCPTCHRAALPEAKPRRGHPPVPGHAELARFGCTPCHGGQGRRLDREAHRPDLGAGPDPFLPRGLRQARCARCHVPTGLAGAPLLERGLREYLDAGCSGCHQPGRTEQGLGPDLRRLGRRSEAELRQSLLDPEVGHDRAVMYSLRWRYDEGTAQGRAALQALIAALLAIAESPAPYASAWARPTLRVDVDCSGCHSMAAGGRAVGRRHRCTLLRERGELRCPTCHADAATRPGERGRECPQVRAARSLCGVCHLRPGDGARP